LPVGRTTITCFFFRSFIQNRWLSVNVQNKSNVVLRSLLFIPGRDKLLDKIIQEKDKWKPDAFILDMEDSVTPSEKIQARQSMQKKLQTISQNTSSLIIPRVNSIATEWFTDDIKAVVGPYIHGISVGKVGTMHDIYSIDDILSQLEEKLNLEQRSLKIIPWLETSLGIANAITICSASSRIVGAAFGADDFLTDMQIQKSSDTHASNHLMDYARSAISIACAANNIQALETPYVNYKNPQGLQDQIQKVKSLGFSGMFAIHPSQVDDINAGFRPSQEEIDYAKQVVAEYEKS